MEQRFAQIGIWLAVAGLVATCGLTIVLSDATAWHDLGIWLLAIGSSVFALALFCFAAVSLAPRVREFRCRKPKVAKDWRVVQQPPQQTGAGTWQLQATLCRPARPKGLTHGRLLIRFNRALTRGTYRHTVNTPNGPAWSEFPIDLPYNGDLATPTVRQIGEQEKFSLEATVEADGFLKICRVEHQVSSS